MCALVWPSPRSMCPGHSRGLSACASPVGVSLGAEAGHDGVSTALYICCHVGHRAQAQGREHCLNQVQDPHVQGNLCRCVHRERRDETGHPL